MKKYNIGFIGAGNMANAIASGLLSGGIVDRNRVCVYDVNQQSLDAFKARHNISVAVDLQGLCKGSDIILLAVKPNVIPTVLSDIRDHLADKAVLSIAAGISTGDLIRLAHSESRVLRVMPNTPAMVSKGCTVLSKDTNWNNEECEFAEQIFKSIGECFWIPEHLIDSATAISGSGPAYVYIFIEALADAGVREGLPRYLAQKFAAQTVLGSASMVAETNKHPGELKDMVCSPGGTTIEAVYALESGGFRAAIMDAVSVCARKAKAMNEKR